MPSRVGRGRVEGANEDGDVLCCEKWISMHVLQPAEAVRVDAGFALAAVESGTAAQHRDASISSLTRPSPSRQRTGWTNPVIPVTVRVNMRQNARDRYR